MSAGKAGATPVAAPEQVVASDSNDNSADQARKTFPCLMCYFVSNWENGLQIHLTRNHANIDQIDGNGTLVGDDFEEDERYSGTSQYWKSGKLFGCKQND